eukprot:c19617_g1_i1 orf=204-713(-)
MQWQYDSISLWSNNRSLFGVATAVDDGHLYVLGGCKDGREVRRFDVKSRLWATMANMHESHICVAVAVLQGCLHVIGGCNKMQSSGEIWDLRTGEWILEPEIWLTQLSYMRYIPPPVAVVMDTLYALRVVDWDKNELKLVLYVSESKHWTLWGTFHTKSMHVAAAAGTD